MGAALHKLPGLLELLENWGISTAVFADELRGGAERTVVLTDGELEGTEGYSHFRHFLLFSWDTVYKLTRKEVCE